MNATTEETRKKDFHQHSQLWLMFLVLWGKADLPNEGTSVRVRI